MSSKAEDSRVSPPVIVLVHGTWAHRSAPWTLDNSPMCRRLREVANGRALIRRFGWSGRNSQTSRAQAAADLVEALCNEPYDQSVPVHLVGHSHGGTIAVRASGLAPGRVASVVALGSPFPVGSPIDNGAERHWAMSVYAVVSLSISVILIWFLTDGWEWLVRTLDWFAPLATGVAVLAVLAVLPLAARFSRRAATVHRAREQGPIEVAYEGFGVATVPTLPIFYRRSDEAYGIMSRALRLRRTLREHGTRWLACVLRFDHLTMPVCWAATAFIVFCLIYHPTGKILYAADAILIVSISFVALYKIAHMALIIFLQGLVFIPVVTSFFSLGAESAFASLFLRLRVVQRPSGNCVAADVTPPLPPGWRNIVRHGLRHSQLCFDPMAIAETARWIEYRVPTGGT